MNLAATAALQVFVFLYGTHGNTGKTTWHAVLRYILGDYVVTAPINIFIVTKREKVR